MRQLAEQAAARLRRRESAETSVRVVAAMAVSSDDSSDARGKPVAGSRAARKVNAASRAVGGHAIVPAKSGARERVSSRPSLDQLPVSREVGLRRERGIVARERDEQRKALHLPREGMRRDERIRRLEVGAGGEDQDVRGPLRGNAGRECATTHARRDERRPCRER